MLTKYCEINHHNIIDIYTEDCSGKSFDRPEWKKIMTFIKKNRGERVKRRMNKKSKLTA